MHHHRIIIIVEIMCYSLESSEAKHILNVGAIYKSAQLNENLHVHNKSQL